MNATLSHAKRLGSASLFVVISSALALSGCSKLKARDLLNKGVQAYKAGQTDQAIEDFKEAASYDPTLTNAKLYLAAAYQGQFIPGAPSAENMRNANQAMDVYRDVLSSEPNNLRALDNVGALLFAMGTNPYNPDQLQQSKGYHEKHIQIKADDPEPYYWVGVIDWTIAWHANQEMRATYNHAHVTKQIKDIDPLPANLRDDFSSKYSAVTQDGVDHLKKAMDLRPDYEDAMAYLSLLYRQQGDMATDGAQRDSLSKQADDLMQQVKQINQSKGTATGD